MLSKYQMITPASLIGGQILDYQLPVDSSLGFNEKSTDTASSDRVNQETNPELPVVPFENDTAASAFPRKYSLGKKLREAKLVEARRMDWGKRHCEIDIRTAQMPKGKCPTGNSVTPADIWEALHIVTLAVNARLNPIY